MTPLSASVEMEQLVHRATRTWASKFGRRVESDDEQVAWQAVLEAARSFDPERGTPFGGYVWKAIMLKLAEARERLRCPVSARDFRELFAFCAEGGVEMSNLPCAFASGVGRPDRLLDHARLRHLVRQVVASTSPLAYEVFIRERKPQVVAREHGVHVRDVYSAQSRARYAVARSREVCQRWKDLRRY